MKKGLVVLLALGVLLALAFPVFRFSETQHIDAVAANHAQHLVYAQMNWGPEAIVAPLVNGLLDAVNPFIDKVLARLSDFIQPLIDQLYDLAQRLFAPAQKLQQIRYQATLNKFRNWGPLGSMKATMAIWKAGTRARSYGTPPLAFGVSAPLIPRGPRSGWSGSSTGFTSANAYEGFDGGNSDYDDDDWGYYADPADISGTGTDGDGGSGTGTAPTNYILDLDASQNRNMSAQSGVAMGSGSVAYNGQKIGTWFDLSSRGNHFGQSDVDKQPIWHSYGGHLNGKPYVQMWDVNTGGNGVFSGYGPFLSERSPSLHTPLDGSHTVMMLVYCRRQSSVAYQTFLRNGNLYWLLVWGSWTKQYNFAGPGVDAGVHALIYRYTKNGATASMSLAVDNPNLTNVASVNPDLTTEAFTLGAIVGGGSSADSEFYKVKAWGRSLTNAEIAAELARWNATWGSSFPTTVTTGTGNTGTGNTGTTEGGTSTNAVRRLRRRRQQSLDGQIAALNARIDKSLVPLKSNPVRSSFAHSSPSLRGFSSMSGNGEVPPAGGSTGGLSGTMVLDAKDGLFGKVRVYYRLVAGGLVWACCLFWFFRQMTFKLGA